MPTLDALKSDMEKLLGSSIIIDEFDRRLDWVKGELKHYDPETGTIRIELNDTNRPDLWSVEGIVRQLLGGQSPSKRPWSQMISPTTPLRSIRVDPTVFTPYLGPRQPFLLYPARGWAHKNHARLIEAVRLLRADEPGLRLVLTGGGLEALGPLPDWVDVRGQVPLTELHELYRQATCLVFPSLYEGFGLPPLEAMASGCPVAASTAGALPEVCGDAAVLFDAEDPVAIAAGVREALERHDELVGRGLQQATRFPWSACAAAHEDAYLAAAR